MSAIVDFLEGCGPDAAGRSAEAVLAFSLAALERHHDYIQWLFPLPEPSRAVPGSPVLTPDDVRRIRASRLAQVTLTDATVLLANFYDSSDQWLVASDHNHLRISRIVRSLRLLVSDAAADRFRDRILDRVEETGAPVSLSSRAYWREA